MQRFTYLQDELAAIFPLAEPSYHAFLLHELDIQRRTIVHHYLSQQTDSAAISFLQNDTSHIARMIEVPLLLAAERLPEAQTVLDAFVPQSNDSTQLQFKAYYDLILQIREDGGELADMTESEENQLLAIAAQNQKYSGNAQSLLYQVFGNEFPVIIDPNPIDGSRLAGANIFEKRIKCYPNPAQQNIIVELVDDIPITSLLIVDLLGRELMKKTIFPSVGKVQLDISALNSGIYWVLGLDSKGQLLEMEKFVHN